ncbi:hypothetical protein DRW07_11360 [Alteromonas sediminis]|uniref:Uncharacterized protein n=1 Tax=Alteromonas sediminis TaxID=2259342 RepID=A0A3N5Y0N3_9ALTE|nr:hypothetical protein [Alteromonas sediminis]RPJ66670.1 hypothetical protein DRW07_11360 [Alteromonas sediminis]
MLAWFTKRRKKTPVTFIHRQACLEAQTLKGQTALKNRDTVVAQRLLQGVYCESQWWFEQSEPSPRLIAMFAGSASLYASALWEAGEYAKAFSIINISNQKLVKASRQKTAVQCRRHFYQHCIEALNQTMEDFTMTESLLN